MGDTKKDTEKSNTSGNVVRDIKASGCGCGCTETKK